MKQALLINPQNIILKDINMDNIYLSANDVLVSVKCVTLCGSDVRYFKMDKLPYGMNYPLILGHEVSGIVEKIGADVKKIKIGDRVAVEPGIWCGNCSYCKKGDYNFCENMHFMASKGFNGGLQEKIVWPEKCLWKLEDKITFDEGAMLEPMSVAYSSLKKLDLSNEPEIMILGAGSIGLLIGFLLQELHPNISYIYVDKAKEKLNLIDKIGLKPFDVMCTDEKNIKLPSKFDILVDTTGNYALIKEMLSLLKKGGQVLCVGISTDNLDLRIKDIVDNGIKIIGNYRFANTYPELICLLNNKNMPIRKLITQEFSFEQTQDAFMAAINNNNNIKILINFDK